MNHTVLAGAAVGVIAATAITVGVIVSGTSESPSLAAADIPPTLTVQQADINHSGAVTISDVILILGRIGDLGYNPCIPLLRVPLDGSVPTEFAEITLTNDYGTVIPINQFAGNSALPVYASNDWHTNPAGVPLLACPLDWYKTPAPTDTPTASPTP